MVRASNANPCLRTRAYLWHEHAWNAFLLVTSRQLNLTATSTVNKKRGDVVSEIKVEMSDIIQRKHWGNDYYGYNVI